MSVPLPVLSNPCIAAASSTSVYLIGIPSAMEGHLQVFSIALDATLDSPIAVPIGKEQVTNTWEVQAKMACFSYGAITSPHGTVLLVQVGAMRTDVANLRSSGVFDYPVQIPDSTIKSTKLLTQVGSYSTFAWFTGFTTTNAASAWKGMRFLSTNVSAYISDEQITQAPTKTPFMTVGTYDISTKSSSTQGYSIVFDSASSGVVYPATGNAESVTGAVSLSTPIALDMQGITLTNKSIPVTMGNVAYILDEAADSSIVAYTIIPSTTNKLSTISITGRAPSFLTVQSATSLYNKIVVYSVNNSSVPSLNVFDAVTRTWSGPGLIGSGTSKPISGTTGATTMPNNGNDNESRFPVAPVVGGVLALAIVACTMFWITRNRRRRRREQGNNGNNTDENESSTQKLEMDPRQQKHSVLTLQEETRTTSSQQQQHAAYPAAHYPSAHITLNIHPHSAPRVPNSAPLPRKDYMSQPQPPYNPQYIQNAPANLQHRVEEEPLGWK
ncbi:hypothetical protein EC957_004331 [Mortierella hygrophila]|uniref:Uncharacterized protein n=1 Tax=Mortierella hygrophila TaxID=979708 RepID=A0A9P6K0M7_9FUNG|nr:hypothetical protein EC957_004331 [Mortierella hygrophila]